MTRWLPMLLVLLVTGCAHRTRIETNPGGASVFIDDRFTCLTPCMYKVPATQLAESPLRIDRTGYEIINTRLETRIMPSRIVGGIFTLGLVPLFKWPRTYRSLHYYDLRPLDRRERLAEIDRQRALGAITEEEHRQLRMRILTEP